MKHAYLIIAHNEKQMLLKLLHALDDERNDIFVHIDKKWKDFDVSEFKCVVKNADIYFIKRRKITWGGTAK